jgi:Zn-dependent metalloprotease
MDRSRRLLPAVLIVVLIFAALPLSAGAAQGPEQNPGRPGFVALTGAEAQEFRLPDAMSQTAVEHLPAYGVTATRYQQMVEKAKVLGGQVTVYTADSGEIAAVIGNAYPNLLTTNEVRTAPGEARVAVAKQIGEEGDWLVDLMVDPTTGRYFYQVENRRFDSRWFYWIDAETGAIVNAYDGMAHGSGTGVLGDTKDLTGLTTFSGGTYLLQSADGRQKTYDARNRSTLPGVLATDTDDLWTTAGRTSPGQPALVDAHFYARVTDTYYQSTHSWNWLNHYSQGMISSAHVQRNYNNAGWNGTQMVYGDGDGSTFKEFSGDLDVVGHELSHGVTEATSNLIYQNESGALNEAFSDIMGTAIEYYYGTGNWTIGEDITIGSNGLRNMANPNEDGDPSHYADRYTGTSDNGGVHINSGIANHWFYLLVNGGQNANPSRASGTNVVGIGLAAAEEIAFLGFTALPATATFCSARAGTIAVATGGQSANVADAWDEVGVTATLCGGGGGGTGPTISNVASRITNAKRGQFAISWTTNVASTSEVTFTCCGTYTNSTLVTSHDMSFNGTKGVLYTYYVASVDANGNRSTAGPFTHQN